MDAFRVPAGEPTSDAPVFLSRREARAAREAADLRAPVVTKAVVPDAPVVSDTPVVPVDPVVPAAVLRSDVALAHPIARYADAAAVTPHAIAKPRRARRNPLRAMASMAVIGGLFAVTALPAYGQSGFRAEEVSLAAAASSGAAISTAAAVSAQSITVSPDLALPELERDQFQATSPEDLEIIRRQSAIASANQLYAASGARQLGDDYPWATGGYELSPLSYYLRQCTDFVAWRLNRDVGSFTAPYRWAWSDLTPNGGNASQWKAAWDAHGWTVSDTPVVGSVAWFGWDNHVAYVRDVNADGSVLLEEYNYVHRSYGQRTLAAADVQAFLYPPGQ